MWTTSNKTSTILLVALQLFNEPSNSTIFKIVTLPVAFPAGNCITLDFYITLLDFSCSLVLGYNWLTWYNIMANILLVSPSSPNNFLQLSNPIVFIPISGTSMFNSKQSNIVIISTIAFLHTLKLPGSNKFQFYLHSMNI